MQNYPVVDRHFGYQALLNGVIVAGQAIPQRLGRPVTAYSDRLRFSAATAAAMRQGYFGDGLPSHSGFEQMAIICEKSGEFEGALDSLNKLDEKDEKDGAATG